MLRIGIEPITLALTCLLYRLLALRADQLCQRSNFQRLNRCDSDLSIKSCQSTSDGLRCSPTISGFPRETSGCTANVQIIKDIFLGYWAYRIATERMMSHSAPSLTSGFPLFVLSHVIDAFSRWSLWFKLYLYRLLLIPSRCYKEPTLAREVNEDLRRDGLDL